MKEDTSYVIEVCPKCGGKSVYIIDEEKYKCSGCNATLRIKEVRMPSSFILWTALSIFMDECSKTLEKHAPKNIPSFLLKDHRVRIIAFDILDAATRTVSKLVFGRTEMKVKMLVVEEKP